MTEIIKNYVILVQQNKTVLNDPNDAKLFHCSVSFSYSEKHVADETSYNSVQLK